MIDAIDVEPNAYAAAAPPAPGADGTGISLPPPAPTLPGPNAAAPGFAPPAPTAPVAPTAPAPAPLAPAPADALPTLVERPAVHPQPALEPLGTPPEAPLAPLAAPLSAPSIGGDPTIPAPLAAPAPDIPVATQPGAPAAAALTAPPAEPEPAPAITTGPAAILSPDASMMPLEMSLPSLPSAAVAPPPNTAAEALGAAGRSPLDITHLEDTPAKKQREKGAAKKAVSRLVLLGLLGGGGWFGYQHGPDLYDEYVTKSDAVNEPDAPLAFPTPLTATAPPVRSAEFQLTDITGSPGTTYVVTTDFETNVARVNVQRETAPDLEVLTFGEAAFVRRMDGVQWYQLNRGGFPLDDRIERGDWIRTLDELLPPGIRQSVTIDRSTESTVGTVPTRRLLVTLDPALLGTASMPQIDAPATDVIGEPIAGEPVADPAVAPADPATNPEGIPAPTDPFQQPVAPVPAAGEPVAQEASPQIEIWVDSTGMIRQITGAPQLGAETITVNSVASEPWVPDFPELDSVLPLTASALFELGL